MSTPTYQTVSVTCPSCRTTFSTPIITIIDAQQNPEAKARLLMGQINIAVCPSCGSGGALGSPLVYHDSEKELLFTFMPSELGMPETEQQRVIGDLTNRVIMSMPPEQRKGYLLRPRAFLRLEAMIEAILEADGISPEMLQEQRAKVDLLEKLLNTPDESARRLVARENDSLIDYGFFELLTLNLEMSQASGNNEVAGRLEALREQLLDWTSQGHDLRAEEEAIESLGDEITREGLLEKLIEAALADETVKIETMVAIARPFIDYEFYRQLTEEIDAVAAAGDQHRAETLQNLRQTLLTLTDKVDAEMQEQAQKRAAVLQKILASEDMEAALRENLRYVDELFLRILSANLRAAEAEGRTEQAAKLGQMGEILTRLIESSQPPVVRLLTRLLSAESPADIEAILKDHPDLTNADLVSLLTDLKGQMKAEGRGDTAEQLGRILEVATRLVGSVPTPTN